MRFSQLFGGSDQSRGWAREVGLTALALIVGFALMPVLIFYAGSAALGRYDGASLERLFVTLYRGLQTGSAASWIVVLGPYGLLLILRGLRVWWRAGAKPV
jgi:hypothetical protein